MKAVVKFEEGYGNLEIRDVPKPKIKENEVMIEIKAAGICGSDIHHYKRGAETGVPAIFRMSIPVVLGHEFSGDVAEIGSGVKGWKVGERIVSETHAHACYECHLCRSGNYYLCGERKGFGSGVDGAFTRYIAVPANLLHRIPDHISYTNGTVLQPAADVVHAVINISRVRPGDSVVVIGPGPIGLLTIQVSKIIGAGKVIIVGFDRHRDRLDIAKKIGADFIINLSSVNLVERMNELTNGKGADVVFEASGSKEGVLDGLKVLAKKGQMTLIGVPTQPVALDLDSLFLKEQMIRTSIMSNWRDYEQAIQLAGSGKLKLEPLVTHVLPITEFEKGFDLILSKKACKVILIPV